MFDVEAARLFEILTERSAPSPLLNLGSSTQRFRDRQQPHVERLLFQPLRDAGVDIVHSDRKAGEGVDLVADIFDPEMRERLKAGGFKCLLAANLLEHVRDPAAVAAACEEIVGPGGLILATVPSSHPYHADPIDTLYRPSPTALAALFRRSELLLAEELVIRTYADDIRARGLSLWGEIGRTLLAFLTAPARPRHARSRLDRWRWHSTPYRVAVVLMAVR